MIPSDWILITKKGCIIGVGVGDGECVYLAHKKKKKSFPSTFNRLIKQFKVSTTALNEST